VFPFASLWGADDLVSEFSCGVFDASEHEPPDGSPYDGDAQADGESANGGVFSEAAFGESDGSEGTHVSS